MVIFRLMMGYALGKRYQVTMPVAKAARLKIIQKIGVRKNWFTIDLRLVRNTSLNFVAYYGIVNVTKIQSPTGQNTFALSLSKGLIVNRTYVHMVRQAHHEREN